MIELQPGIDDKYHFHIHYISHTSYSQDHNENPPICFLVFPLSPLIPILLHVSSLILLMHRIWNNTKLTLWRSVVEFAISAVSTSTLLKVNTSLWRGRTREGWTCWRASNIMTVATMVTETTITLQEEFTRFSTKISRWGICSKCNRRRRQILSWSRWYQISIGSSFIESLAHGRGMPLIDTSSTLASINTGGFAAIATVLEPIATGAISTLRKPKLCCVYGEYPSLWRHGSLWYIAPSSTLRNG